MRTIDADRLKAVLEKNFGHTGGASVLEQLIDEQPTIEPSTNCSEIPNSSDTISRQAVIDELSKFVPYVICDESTESYTNGLTDAYNLICQLPPAQPEPQWIPVEKELPEPRINVWVNSDLGQMVGYYDEMVNLWYGRGYLELIVNAWMPLPEAYKPNK